MSGPTPMTMEQRLRLHDKTDGGCWEWSGWRLPSGYGTLRIRAAKRTVLAHRLAYETWVGPIPDGLQVLHRCDNPPCINPAHLFLGTQRDNLLDSVSKGRYGVHSRPRTAYRGWKLTESQAREAIQRRQGGERADSVARDLGVSPGYVRMLAGSRRSPHL